jgi:predicted DNA-binding transcriptional regulator AlpA
VIRFAVVELGPMSIRNEYEEASAPLDEGAGSVKLNPPDTLTEIAKKSRKRRAPRQRGQGAGTPRGPPVVGRRFYSFQDLGELGVPYTRDHLKRMEDLGAFPRRVVLGGGNGVRRFIAWVASEVDTWVEAKIAARDRKSPRSPAELETTPT